MEDERLAFASMALRPSAGQASRAWSILVAAEKEQVERLPDRPRPEDFYGPIAESFRADPRRGDDEVLDAVRSLVRPGETWLDVGAGGGRYTLPIALLAGRVYAVEPSAGMREALAASAREHGIDNVETFAERWPGPSTVPVADVSFISHVGYDIEQMGAFLDQMEQHTSRTCVALLFERAPISDFAPLWPAVHGEERVLLPGLGEFIALLFARGRVPEIRLFAVPPRTYADLDALQRAVRRPLWVLEGSEQDERLRRAVEQLAVPVEGGVGLSGRERKLGLVTWEADGSAPRA